MKWTMCVDDAEKTLRSFWNVTEGDCKRLSSLHISICFSTTGLKQPRVSAGGIRPRVTDGGRRRQKEQSERKTESERESSVWSSVCLISEIRWLWKYYNLFFFYFYIKFVLWICCIFNYIHYWIKKHKKNHIWEMLYWPGLPDCSGFLRISA